MKVKTEKHLVESSGTQESKAFSIKASSWAFMALSSGLYKDKIGAVVRELLTNAVDATKDALVKGLTTRRVQLKLPTALDSQFYVKDWGTGMTHEETMRLYTTYFDSTKRDSNDVTGCIGVGSKAPYAISSQYSVMVSQGGIVRMYSMYIGENGEPMVDYLGQTNAPADWQHGVQISIPVSPKEYHLFPAKAEQICRWFDEEHTPEIVGSRVNIRPMTPRYKGSNWILPVDESESRIIMGNIAYPLDISQLGDDDIRFSDLDEGAIHIKVNIGDVNMTISREELQYDKPTIAWLKSELLRIHEEFGLLLRKDFDKKPKETEWDRYARIYELYSQLPWRVQNSLERFLESAGVAKDDASKMKSVFSKAAVQLPRWLGKEIFAKEQGLQVFYFTQGRNNCTARQVINGDIMVGSSSQNAYLPIGSTATIYYADVKHSKERVRQDYENRSAKGLLMIVPKHGATVAEAEDLAKRLSAELGGVPVKPTSSLPEPVIVKARAKYVKGAKAVVTSQTLNQAYASEECILVDIDGYGNHSVSLRYADTTTIGKLPADARLFMIQSPHRSIWSRKYFMPVSTHQEWTTRDMESLIEGLSRLHKAGFTDLPKQVVFMKPIVAKRLKVADANSEWKPFIPAIVEAMSKPAFVSAIEAKISLLPKTSVSAKEGTWAARSNGGNMGMLCWIAANDESVWTELKAVLDANDIQTIEEIVAINKDTHVASLRDHVVKVLSELKQAIPALAKTQSSSGATMHDFNQLWEAKYPAMRLMHANNFEDSYRNNKKNVVKMLSAIFSLKG